MELAGFDLRGWEYSYDNAHESQAAVLGMLWDKQNDNLYLNVSSFRNNNIKKVTKRVILAMAHTIFDPLGIVCPIMITSRLLLQETWGKQIFWDEEVDDNIRNRFERWVDNLQLLEEIRIPRCLLGNITNKNKISLHILIKYVHHSKLSKGALRK